MGKWLGSHLAVILVYFQAQLLQEKIHSQKLFVQRKVWVMQRFRDGAQKICKGMYGFVNERKIFRGNMNIFQLNTKFLGERKHFGSERSVSWENAKVFSHEPKIFRWNTNILRVNPKFLGEHKHF